MIVCVRNNGFHSFAGLGRRPWPAKVRTAAATLGGGAAAVRRTITRCAHRLFQAVRAHEVGSVRPSGAGRQPDAPATAAGGPVPPYHLNAPARRRHELSDLEVEALTLTLAGRDRLEEMDCTVALMREHGPVDGLELAHGGRAVASFYGALVDLRRAREEHP